MTGIESTPQVDSTDVVTSSKKNSLSNDTIIQVLGAKCRRGRVHSTKEMRDILGISKQRLNYWLEKMCDDGILIRLDKGLYRMTESGKKIYDQYERLRGKQLVRIENMHVSYRIVSGVTKFGGALTWKRTGVKKVWVSTIENHTVRLIKKDGWYEFQVYITKVLGTSPYDAYYHARLEADKVATKAEWWGVKLSIGWVSFEPEIAIPSPIASALLTITESSHIRTDKGVMNRSKGRIADWEPRDLQQAQKIVDMPDTLERIEDEIRSIKERLPVRVLQLYNSIPWYFTNWQVF